MNFTLGHVAGEIMREQEHSERMEVSVVCAALSDIATDADREEAIPLREAARMLKARSVGVDFCSGLPPVYSTQEGIDGFGRMWKEFQDQSATILSVCRVILGPDNQNILNGDVVASVRDVAQIALNAEAQS